MSINQQTEVQRKIPISDKLPKDWNVSSLDDITEVIMGQSPSSKFYSTDGQGLPFFQGKAEFGELYPQVRKWCSKPNKVAKKDDILLSVRAPVGPTNLSTTECCIGRGLAAIRPKEGISNKYVLYYLRSIENDIESLGTGTTFKAISGKVLREIPIPVAPLDQQRIIVAEIEKQFSRLDEAVTSLKRAKANLERYKAAVLKAAVEGKLTEEWRKQHPDVEPASELLKRILAEGRRKWEEAELHNIFPIPRKWSWARLKDVFDVITDGDHQAPPKSNAGIPFLVIGNLSSGNLDFSSTRFVKRQYYDSLAVFRKPQKGDLLYTVVGSYGIPIKVDTDIPFCVQRHVAILKPNAFVLSDYLYYMLLSSSVYEQSTKVATGTAQKTVPLGGLRNIRIPIPPLDEQVEIVSLLDAYFSSVISLEKTIEEDRKCGDRIKQAILSQAYKRRGTEKA
ncbi:MAG: restriction endonuclease subunit S [Thermoleophilia bacterium]